MLVLGIESTCDETGCAIVQDGREILSNVIATQEDLHSIYGGVIPELACRRHIDTLTPLLQKALDEAHISSDHIDVIAVAHGPGLIGALLIGINFAKGLAFSLNKPLVGVNHVEAHLYSVFMGHTVPLPALGVVLSGGHTCLLEIQSLGDYRMIGQTQDDAVGEAFDKVAKILELPYPGGPHIEKLARSGNPFRYPFKGGVVKGDPFSFSFSGLKTAVLYAVRGQNCHQQREIPLTAQDKADLAASFQYAASNYLVEKILFAAQEIRCRSIVLGGGVTQNRFLRHLLEEKASCPVLWPPRDLSLDNAAMIAGLGHHLFLQKGACDMNLEALTRIPL